MASDDPEQPLHLALLSIPNQDLKEPPQNSRAARAEDLLIIVEVVASMTCRRLLTQAYPQQRGWDRKNEQVASRALNRVTNIGAVSDGGWCSPRHYRTCMQVS